MKNKNTKPLMLILGIVLLLSLIHITSAVIVENVNQDTLYPGGESTINIELQNNLKNDVDDISLSLDFTKVTLFTAIGTSEKTLTTLNEDKSKTLNFDIKASNSIEPGDYSIPYNLHYSITSGNTTTTYNKTGTIGVTVNSKTKLDYIAVTEKPIIGQKTKLSLKIVNKGFGEIKFVSVIIQPEGFTLLSGNNVYVGSISSDDFQTADFDVIFTKKNPVLSAVVTYKDFENNDKTENVNLDIKAYTQEEALKLGLTTKSKLPYLFVIIIIVAVVLFVRRTIKKRKKNQIKNNGSVK